MGPTASVIDRTIGADAAAALEIAAWVSGYFSARAGLLIIPAPLVRRVQREQLSTALPWALREVGLTG